MEISDDLDIRWVSGHDFVEQHSKAFAAKFNTSKPRPRNREMGFSDDKRMEREDAQAEADRAERRGRKSEE